MFRFTIRDVFWLTAVVAVAVGWALEWNAHRLTSQKYLEFHRKELLQVDAIFEAAEQANVRFESAIRSGNLEGK